MFGGILYLLKKLKVDNILIGKQFEKNTNYMEFLNITKGKNVKVLIAGEKINLTNTVRITVLWPDKSSKITENSINNNALVFKLETLKKTILFTGDIEEETENVLVQKYKNTKSLKSDILKVAHHGSKSSSIQEFLDLVQPQIALIGVGENNKFNHPNEEVIDRLEKKSIKIYRTDKNGEISLKINKCIKITKMVNNISKEKSR